MISIAGRLAKVFRGAKVGAILVVNTKSQDSNFVYLTGFTEGLFEGAALIATRRKLILLTNPLEYQVARKQRPKEMLVVNVKSRKQIMSYFNRYAKGRSVGVNGSFIPYSRYRYLKKLIRPKRFVDVSENFERARAIKDDEEIRRISLANRIIKKVLSKVEREFRTGMTERGLAARVDRLMQEYGADGPSFPTIVCFGANASIPHHTPGPTRLTPNNFVLIDCGCTYGSYCSDVTRTFIFKPQKGSPKYKTMMEMLQTVREAQRIAMGSIRPGIPGKKAHLAAEKIINEAHGGKFKGKFIHSLGHPVGIEVHDVGAGLYPSETEKLQEGMVVSNEPGIYIEGFGGVRIEDDVLVTKGGPKTL